MAVFGFFPVRHPFWLADPADSDIYCAAMKRQMIRLILALLVVLTSLTAAWMWSAKYEKDSDPQALFRIEGAQVKRDRGYRWLDVHLKRVSEKPLDFSTPILLVSGAATEHKPDDITFAGSPEAGFTDIWLKFWLEDSDLEGTLQIHINEGVLNVKTTQGGPELEDGAEQTFKSSNWQKSWLGF